MNRRTFIQAAAGTVGAPFVRAASPWRAGVATIDITPRVSMWMAGFAARKRPSQGVALPLHAKALALEDARGRRTVLVTLDLLGVTGNIADRIAGQARRRLRLPRERLLLASSHTHSGPVVDHMLRVAYDLTPEQQATIVAYTRGLESQVVDLIASALGALEPASLHTGESRATFAANRRTPGGPVDHRVPMLVVEARGAPRAVVFGYACHNTTLRDDEVEFHGDYSGVAQAALEARHPGLTALYIAGCGADANPSPRGTRALVTRHGEALADAVDEGLGSTVPVRGPISAAFDVIDLPLAPFPDAAEWRRRATADDVYVRRHAALMLERLSRDGRLAGVLRDPVQVWRFGRDLTLVALGGEVVVDYALRLYREHPGERLWVSGYANDVFGYVPSLRVLEEGGYEGGGAMLYYGQPGPFDRTVEERVMTAVTRLLRATS